MNSDFIEKAKNLKLLLTDIDGVMTDSKLPIYTDEKGNIVEIKNFERKSYHTPACRYLLQSHNTALKQSLCGDMSIQNNPFFVAEGKAAQCTKVNL